MIAGGWIKNQDGEYIQYYEPNETSIMCTPQELEELIGFFQHIKAATDEAGECIKHYQHWSSTWKKGDLDIVIIVSPTSS